MEMNTNTTEVTSQSLTSKIQAVVNQWHLLKHPFYQIWNEGALDSETLQLYARQYGHHVRAFPRYLSMTHSNCENIQNRQVLLENLNEEERGSNNHPELWRRFSEGLGNAVHIAEDKDLHPETKALVDTFFGLAQGSYAEGLGALYAYESQVPEIAQTKIEGLKKFYGLTDSHSLEFFNVHLHADVVHRQEVKQLIEGLSEGEQEKALEASEKACKALWQFLDGMHRQFTARNPSYVMSC